jgi:hypothetical protein
MPHQVGGELGEPFGCPPRLSPFNGDVLPLDVAELPQSVPEGIVGTGTERLRTEHANPRNLRQVLRFGGKRRKNETDIENDRKPDQPHEHLVETTGEEASRWTRRGTAGLTRRR